jgi:hypothetical protein
MSESIEITYIYEYKCPICKKEHGHKYANFDNQIAMLCDECFKREDIDINLRIKRLEILVAQLERVVDHNRRVSSCLEVLR